MITIGINANFDTEKQRINMPNDYITAIIRAGALPVLLPLTDREDVWRAMVDNVDGMVFPGGEDIHPEEYGQEVHPKCADIVPERDKQELFTYRYLLSRKKPFLAICRGLQLVNVAHGGNLIQDIPSQFETDIEHQSREAAAHEVQVVPGTLLHQLMRQNKVNVNSRHHQNIQDLGEGLKANAYAPDGLIEGLEFENGYPGLAFQWHPENLSETQPEMQRLFDWLVAEASKAKTP